MKNRLFILALVVVVLAGCGNELESYCPEEHATRVVELAGRFEEIEFSEPVLVDDIDPVTGLFGSTRVTVVDADIDGRAEALSVTVTDRNFQSRVTSRYNIVDRKLVRRDGDTSDVEVMTDIDRDGRVDEVSTLGIRWGGGDTRHTRWPRDIRSPVHVTDDVGPVVLGTLPPDAATKPFARFRITDRNVIDETDALPDAEPIYVQSFTTAKDFVVAAGWSWMSRRMRVPIAYQRVGRAWSALALEVPYGAPMGALVDDTSFTITYEPQIVTFDRQTRRPYDAPFTALCLPPPVSHEPSIPWGIAAVTAGDTLLTCIAFGFDSPDKAVKKSNVRCFTNWGAKALAEVGPRTLGGMQTNFGDYRFIQTFRTQQGQAALAVSSVACSPRVYVYVQ